MRLFLNSFILLISMACFSLTSHAAPKAELLSQWLASNETNTASIDHNAWQALLNSYISEHESGINLINYATLKSNDKEALEAYLDDLLDIDPREYNKKEQFAYWVNLYNAATVALIIENYPVKSITDIKDGLLSFGPWDREWLEIGEDLLSLNDIEHRILRPIWQDNRIHYAVNCASLSCPNLSTQAFTAINTESLLNTLAAEYINHPRGVSLDKGKLTLSSIYHWYEEDFNNDTTDIISHLSRFAKPELRTKLNALKNDSFKHDYNWELNSINQKIVKY